MSVDFCLCFVTVCFEEDGDCIQYIAHSKSELEDLKDYYGKLYPTACVKIECEYAIIN